MTINDKLILMNVILLLSPGKVIGGAEKYILTLYECSSINEVPLNYTIACSHNYNFYKELKNLNYNVFWLGKTITDCAISLDSIIVKNKIELLHTSGYHSSFIAISYRNKYRRKRRMPKILSTEHGWVNDTEQSKRLSKLNFKLLSHLDYIVVVNRSMLTSLLSQGYTNVTFIKTPLSITYIANRRDDKNKLLRKNILGIGRFEPVKNFQFFIHVAAELCSLDPQFKFLLVGSGSEEEEIEHAIRKLHLDSNIVIHKFSSHVLNHYKDSDVLLMTSISEGTPLVLLESISMGLIPVVPALDGIKAVSEHTNLFWFDDYTVANVISKIRSLYNTSVKHKDVMLEQGFDYIERHHNPRITLQNYIKVYQILCQKL